MKKSRNIQKLEQKITELENKIELSKQKNKKFDNLMIQKLEYEDMLSELLFE